MSAELEPISEQVTLVRNGPSLSDGNLTTREVERLKTVLEQSARRSGPLEDRREELLRDLAGGDETQAQLARRYGVSSEAVRQFRQRNAAAIEVAKQRMAVTLDSLWIAQKELRIARQQRDYEASDNSEYRDHFKQIQARTDIANSVSEQLGQTPPRQQIVVQPAVYILQVEGLTGDQITDMLT